MENWDASDRGAESAVSPLHGVAQRGVRHEEAMRQNQAGAVPEGSQWCGIPGSPELCTSTFIQETPLAECVHWAAA